MDQPPVRDVVLRATSPRDLFGEAVDDARELRRAYASLLKAFHPEDDPEAHAHVRALYDQAREAHEAAPVVSVHEDAVVSAVVATFDQDVSALIQAIAEHRESLVREHPDLLGHAIHRAMMTGGPTLDLAALDLLDAIVRDPRWEVGPRALDQLDMGLSTIRQLRVAWADPSVPAPLRDFLQRRWGLPDDEVAVLFLDVAERLRHIDLSASLAHLEKVHPAALAHIVGARYHMVRCVLERSSIELPKRQRMKLRRAYPPSLLWLDEWYSRLGGGVAIWPLRIVLTLLFFPALLPFMPLWGAAIGGYLLQLVLLGMVATVYGGLWADRALARAHQGDIEPLLELCRKHTLFPEEIVSVIYDEPVEFDDDAYAFIPGHPVLEIERDDTALFKVITSAHVQRIRAAMESSDE